METKTEKADMASRDDFAPEVVIPASDLIPAQRDTELPQALPPASYQYQPYQMKHPHEPAPIYDGGNTHLPYEKQDPLPRGETMSSAVPADDTKAQTRRRRMWIAVGVVLILLAVALGVGLGVGLSQGNDDSSDNARTNITTSTSTPPPTSTTSAASPGVTSGTTGLTEFSCTGLTEIESADGTEYTQQCNVQYLSGRPSFYVDSRNVANLGNPLTLYSFPECLDACDDYNSEDNQPACRAVTYYANLTDAIPRYRGNCFLKSDRGDGIDSDAGVDLRNTASAWQSCLNVTCFGSA